MLKSLSRRRTPVFVAFSPVAAFGWGGLGHQVVCIIAEDHLTPQARAQIHALLGDAQISDAEIASWADEIHRDHPDTAPWHYVDIPTTAATYDPKRDGNSGNNVIDAIETQAKILVDKSKPKNDRAEALKFLVHFMGDITQPLHCADRNNDRGGNSRLVFYPGQRQATNLHSVWDTALLKDDMHNRRVLDYAEALDKKITDKQRQDWARGTPEQWANESHRLAVEDAYAGIPEDGPPPRIDDNYIQKNEKVVEEQLEKAGVRLAAALNNIFK